MVSLPIYSTSIAAASDMLADVPNCNAVFRWKRMLSCFSPLGFDSFFTVSSSEEDFTVVSAYGYWINVTTSGTWNPPNP
jgi:hypothetical protein